MKLLYVAPVALDFEKPNGVDKKIISHVKVFSSSFHTVLIYRCGFDVMLYRANEGKHERLMHGTSKLDILKAAKQLIKREAFDCSYIRYPMSEPRFLTLLRAMQKRNMKIAVEIPTYPYSKQGIDTWKGRLIKRIDKLFRGKLKRYVHRIVTYSEDKEIFGIPTIKTVNGYDFEQTPVVESIPPKAYHFTAVSGMSPLHGYDRLIEGMHRYYSAGGDRELVFDIVGHGEMSDAYAEMVRSYRLEERVILHGKLFGMELEGIYESSVLGVNSLAIHREGLERESTLKTREYAAKGLPMISSSYVDALDECGNENYVFRIPADDSPVDVAALLSFLDGLYAKEDLQSLRRAIRQNALSVCDMAVTLAGVTAFFFSEGKDDKIGNDG